MKRILSAFLLMLSVLLLCACARNSAAEEPPQAPEFQQISAEEAKKLMDTETGYVIVDARTQEEFGTGHIPGAIVIPDDSVAQQAPSKLPDKGQLILVYCRSGRRSKIAAAALAEMGYTNVKEFGGIIDWPYDIEQ